LIQIPADQYENPQNATRVTKLIGVAALAICVAATGLAVMLILSAR
jgi:K+-transporting ATPase A subunit